MNNERIGPGCSGDVTVENLEDVFFAIEVFLTGKTYHRVYQNEVFDFREEDRGSHQLHDADYWTLGEKNQYR